MTTESEGLAPAVEQAWAALTDRIFNTAEHGDDENAYAAWLLDVARARDEFIAAIQADCGATLRPHLDAIELILPKIEEGQRDAAALLKWAAEQYTRRGTRVADLEAMIRDGLGAVADEVKLQNGRGESVAAKLGLWAGHARKLLHRA